MEGTWSDGTALLIEGVRRVGEAYVVHGSDLRVDGKIIYIPIYMMGALCKSLVGEREQASNEGIDGGSDENPWSGFSE